MPRIYLDYAATTPVNARVLRAMQPYFSQKFGNAGSLHSFGQEAIAAVDRSRETIANALGAEFREVIFTASATEANNLVLKGIRPWAVGPRNARVIVSSVEHKSVLETARELEKEGVEVIYIPVNKLGIIDLKKFQKSLSENTVLVSIMYVNNEIGTVQPIRDIKKILHEFHARLPRAQGLRPKALFHVDAAQAFNHFDCNVNELGVDLMTLSSHKIYGPKGAAALYVRKGTDIEPSLSGGGQEFGLRSGTENVPAVVGFAEAVTVTGTMRAKESKRLRELREYFWKGIKKIHPKAEVNGDREGAAPHIINVYFPEVEAQDLLTRLDIAGVAASSGSACRSRALESSYVIEALGHGKIRAKSSVRFSFGRQTSRAELTVVLKILKRSLLF